MLGCSRVFPPPVKLPLCIILPLIHLAGTYRAPASVIHFELTAAEFSRHLTECNEYGDSKVFLLLL